MWVVLWNLTWGKLLPVSRPDDHLDFELAGHINFLEKMISTTKNWSTLNVPYLGFWFWSCCLEMLY